MSLSTCCTIIYPDFLYRLLQLPAKQQECLFSDSTSSHPTWMFQILVGMFWVRLLSTILVSCYCNNDDLFNACPSANINNSLGIGLFWVLHIDPFAVDWGHRTFHSRVGHATNSLFDMEYHDLSTFPATISNEESHGTFAPFSSAGFFSIDYEKMSIPPQG